MNDANALRIGLTVAVVVIVTVGSLALFGPIGIVAALIVLGAIWALGAVVRTPGTPTA
jgi:hypothetical protein